MTQREIKFRAWDTLNGVMEQMHAIEYLARTETRNQKRFILMQFTGLLDKNGKEVFEGDILQYGPWKEQIVWHGSFWGLKWRNLSPYPLYLMEATQWEIIGNIYENPDLLPAHK